MKALEESGCGGGAMTKWAWLHLQGAGLNHYLSGLWAEPRGDGKGGGA